MRVYALYDESLSNEIVLAYIFYYSKTNEWYIEISNEVESQWQLPFILDHFYEHGYKTVDEYWSRKFIEHRIIPPDRQNIGSILKECNLDTYDEFALFEIADGRCAQDDCYIRKMEIDELPDDIIIRRGGMIETVTQIECSDRYLVTLQDGTVGILEIERLKEKDDFINRILKYYTKILEVTPGCHGAQLSIQGGNAISYEIISHNLKRLPINTNTLKEFAENEIISTTEAMEILGCSRQNLDDLVKRGKLQPAKIKGKSRMYFRSDINRR